MLLARVLHDHCRPKGIGGAGRRQILVQETNGHVAVLFRVEDLGRLLRPDWRVLGRPRLASALPAQGCRTLFLLGSRKGGCR